MARIEPSMKPSAEARMAATSTNGRAAGPQKGRPAAAAACESVSGAASPGACMPRL
jgi:hypothetical protein